MSTQVRIGRKKREGGQGIMYAPTYRAEPNETPDWRRVRALLKDIMDLALKDVTYSSFLAENGSRILAATIVQRLKSLNFERYVDRVRSSRLLSLPQQPPRCP